MKTIALQCANCGRDFDKELKEHKRQIKKGATRFFCGLSCLAVVRNIEHPNIGNIENFGAKIGTKKDEYTPFRYFVLRAKYRSNKKGYQCNITPEYLKLLWEQQEGKCQFTNWKIILPHGTDYGWDTSSPMNASVDRIDNSKGYVEGNVRFISYMANLARQTFTDDQLINFCMAVAATH